MPQVRDWWALQFVEGAKEIAKLYTRFEAICDLVSFDRARQQCDDLNKAYDISLDLLDFVKLGRSLLGKHDLPPN